MIKIITLILILTLFSCQSKADKKDESKSKTVKINNQNITVSKPTRKYIPDLNNKDYDYITKLKNGFRIEYRVFTETNTIDTLQTIILMYEDKEIKDLNGGSSFGLPIKNIGYIGADFDSSFVLVQSFGSGNPHYIQLIKKKTGEIILTGTWVDAEENEQILLYLENEFEDSEILKIYDIKNKKEIIITGFENSKCVKNSFESIRYCVVIDTVTAEYITLKTTSDNDMLKNYIR